MTYRNDPERGCGLIVVLVITFFWGVIFTLAAQAIGLVGIFLLVVVTVSLLGIILEWGKTL